MGSRKRLAAEKRKEQQKAVCMAKLTSNPTSPRKARLMADVIRGKNVDEALSILKYSAKEVSEKMYKLVLSAVANWQHKNENTNVDDANLYIKEVFVDGGTILKRLRTAPQGRAYRVRKRSNHITLVVDSRKVETTIETTESK